MEHTGRGSRALMIRTHRKGLQGALMIGTHRKGLWGTNPFYPNAVTQSLFCVLGAVFYNLGYFYLFFHFVPQTSHDTGCYVAVAVTAHEKVKGQQVK